MRLPANLGFLISLPVLRPQFRSIFERVIIVFAKPHDAYASGQLCFLSGKSGKFHQPAVFWRSKYIN
jgi:hypothetical protein